MPEQTKEKIRASNKGRLLGHRNFTQEQVEKRNKAVKLAISKENHWNWKGGISPLYTGVRKMDKYYKWRTAVFERDKHMCKECGNSTSGNLNAHHIQSFSQILNSNKIKELEDAHSCEQLWDINNGITLCKECHKKLHKGDVKL